MKRILFVCHGNICRSPMAEFILKKMTRQAGLENEVEVASAATSTEELGNPVYPMARQELAMHGIGCAGHKARQLTAADYDSYDLIIGMDRANIDNILHIVGNDPDGKVRMLLKDKEIADPWYTRNFRAAWNDIHAGCTTLFNEIAADAGTAD